MGNQKRRHNKVSNIVISIAVIAALFIGAFFYVRAIKKTVTAETSEYLGEIAKEGAQLVEEKFDGGMKTLTAMANLIGVMDVPVDDPMILEALEQEIRFGHFQNLSVASTTAQSYNVIGQTYYDVSDRYYYKQAIQGKPTIEIVTAKDTKIEIVVLAVPIFRDTKTIGVLTGRYDLNKLIDILSINSFGGEGYSYLADSKGTIFAAADHPKSNKELENIDWIFASSDSQMQENMQKGASGQEIYELEGILRIMNYVPIGVNDWYLLSVVQDSVIQTKSSYFITQTAMLFGTVFIIFLFVIVYSLNQQKKKNEALRIANRENAESQKRNDLIMGQCQEIIFEWNVEDGTVYYTKEYYQEKFGMDPITENFPQSVVGQHIVVEEDESTFCELFEEVLKQECFIERDFRILNSSGDDIWCRVRVMSIFDMFGVAYKVIGIIADIDNEKREHKRMEEAASRDFLTKIYNKGGAEKQIKQWIKKAEEDQMAAFFIIDIDNFKGINDTFGHVYGDKVLREIADRLSSVMRETDIVGRIGGDEFVVFMKDIKEESIFKRKADELIVAFKTKGISELGDYTISGSIGVAIYGKHGKTYEDLFRKADEALYYAKKHGKNQYSVYYEEEV